MASSTMMGKRARFSRLPPYLSLRWFSTGEMNWLSSHEWPPWTRAMSAPPRLAMMAASANCCATSSISSSVISSQTLPLGITLAEGPMGLRPPLYWGRDH